MAILVGDRTLQTDAEGFLAQYGDWQREVALAMASADEIELTEPHWQVIELLRDYYQEYDVAPPVRILTKQVGKRLGKDKGNSRYLFSLFPLGPAKQACRYAGLPKPTGCV